MFWCALQFQWHTLGQMRFFPDTSAHSTPIYLFYTYLISITTKHSHTQNLFERERGKERKYEFYLMRFCLLWWCENLNHMATWMAHNHCNNCSRPDWRLNIMEKTSHSCLNLKIVFATWSLLLVYYNSCSVMLFHYVRASFLYWFAFSCVYGFFAQFYYFVQWYDNWRLPIGSMYYDRWHFDRRKKSLFTALVRFCVLF